MIETIKNAWKIDDLRKKMMFTLFIIVLFRFGAKIPVPFLDASVLQTYMQINSGTIFSYLDMLSGGAFHQPLYQRLHHHPASHGGHSGPGAAGQRGR